MMELVIHRSAEETADSAARRISDGMAEAEGEFSLGLAGGSTPRATYEALESRDADWSRVTTWLSDERWVPQTHERCNGRMAAETLMNHVDATFHRPRWSEYMEPSDSAAHYEAVLRHLHPDKGPDLVVLGMGEDGHTASLFPETEALSEMERWFVANRVPKLGETRLTATFPLLWQAKLLVVLVVGAHKAEALKATAEGTTPAARLVEGDAKVEWHVDSAAASLLS